MAADRIPFPPPLPGTHVRPGDDDRSLLAAPSRQSPVALLFIAWRFVRRLGWSAVAAAVLFVVNGGLALGAWFLAVPVAGVLAVSSGLSWWRFTFCVTGDELVVTRGVVSVERLVIPLDRVQSVGIDQRLAHRVFGLVSASVDTAGSATVELEIDAIDRPRAEALRRLAADARPTAVDPATAPLRSSATTRGEAGDEVVLRRSLGDLVLVGLTRAPLAGLVALVPLVALGDELGQLAGIGERLERALDRTGVGDGWSASTVLAIVGVVALIVVAGSFLQVVQEVVRNWDLTLFRTATGLRRTAGLLSTTSRSSTARRIQSLTTDDSPPQRWIGITNVHLRTFGANDVGLPGSRPDEVAALRELVFGTRETPALDRRISRWYVFRASRNALAVTVVAAAALSSQIGWWATLVLAVVPFRAAAAHRRWTLRRWSLGDDRLADSDQLLHRRTVEVPLYKAQVVSVSQGFFERRKGLATLHVRTAAGSVAIPLIPYAEAVAGRDRIVRAVETDRRRVL